MIPPSPELPRLSSPEALPFLSRREPLCSLDPARMRQRGLTQREMEVLHWICEGKRDAEIARILGVSPRTIQCHVGHVFAKLGVETRTAAANTAHAFRAPHPMTPQRRNT